VFRLNLKVAKLFKKFLKPLRSSIEYVQSLFNRNVLDLYQPDRHSFNIDGTLVICGTQIMSLRFRDILDLHCKSVAVSPTDKLLVAAVLFVGAEVEVILFYL
jgi:hypothetical protein